MVLEAITNLSQLSALSEIPVGALLIILIWSLIWKGVALWTAARKNHLVWFIVLLVVNTVGILEILYIFLFSKLKFEQPKANQKKRQERNRNKKEGKDKK